MKTSICEKCGQLMVFCPGVNQCDECFGAPKKKTLLPPLPLVKFKKLDPRAVIPSYAKPGDAGLDLTAIMAAHHDKYSEYHTGLAMELPPGHVGLIFPRSSITNRDMMLKNAVGVIDAGYRGQITARFQRLESGINVYQCPERIAQLVILPIPRFRIEEADELTATERGTGGYGSTGSV